jgi:hypothetical protein
MNENPTPPSQRAGARAAAKGRRAKRIERREAWFELFSSGYTHRQIADAMKVSVATVRREIDGAIDERRLDSPDRYIHVQVSRLSRALCHADLKLANGDARAFAPFIKLSAELGRLHGLDGRDRRAPGAARSTALLQPPAPLALTHAVSPLAAAAVSDDRAAQPATAAASGQDGRVLRLTH